MRNGKKIILSTVIASTLFITACQTTPHYVDTKNDKVVVMGLDYKDFENTANEAVDDMIASPSLIHPNAAQGGRWVLAISNIVNDTMQRIDTDQLTKKIRVRLLNSGRFVTTTAIGLNGAEDQMTAQVRELKNSKMVKQSTVKKNGTVIAPDFSMSGKIIQKNHHVKSGTEQVEYYFQLSLTNLENGLAYWEGEYPIIKRGGDKSVSW